MVHDHAAMSHMAVEGMSPASVSQTCQTNCATLERLAVSREAVARVIAVQRGTVALETTVKFLGSDLATSRSVDGSPPEPLSAYASSFSILRI